jgi:Xaa-Pro aminopeptidase
MKGTEYFNFFPPREDLQIRWNSVRKLLADYGGDACLVTSNVNIYYLTGQIFAGYVYLSLDNDPIYFVQRPNDMEGEQVIPIRKPEDICELLKERNLSVPENLFLEADQLTYNEYIRLETAFNLRAKGNATALLRKSRQIKTAWEIGQFRISATKHAEAYQAIPILFREGMTDVDFQIEIERNVRKHGSLGTFRTFGSNMEIFMGSLLTGNNAEKPSPFDFALGGSGMHPCIPIGATGEKIREGMSVMVDMAGNYTAYMSDMTRVFSLGKLSEEACRAHRVSMDMHDRLMETAKQGTSCSEIYEWSLKMAEKSGLAPNFMGTKQQAKFVGHGVGLEINEMPILMQRSKETLQTGMVFAYEPKFVIPGTGAVGNENTFLVTDTGIEKLTVFEENIGFIPFSG